MANEQAARTASRAADEARTTELVLGSKHGRPVFPADSDVGSDASLDPAVAEKFLKTADGKSRYAGVRYVPAIAFGDNLTVDQAVKHFRDFVSTLHDLSKADTIRVEKADGSVLYEGKRSFPVAENCPNERTMASHALHMLMEQYVLNHRQALNTALRAQMKRDAVDENVLKSRGITDRKSAFKPESAKTGKTRANKQGGLI
jgi:hypothetical protein